MSTNTESVRIFRPTERRQSQFDELDNTLILLANSQLSEEMRIQLTKQADKLKLIISLQGADVGEFE